MTTVGSRSTMVLTRVCTVTVVEVSPAGRTAETGGVTMSWEPAVPLEVRFTVMALLDDADALITKVAGAPCETSSSTDWMVRTGVTRGSASESRAVEGGLRASRMNGVGLVGRRSDDQAGRNIVPERVAGPLLERHRDGLRSGRHGIWDSGAGPATAPRRTASAR